MSKKSDITAKLLAKIPLQRPIPEPLADANLVEQGLNAILLRRLTPAEAKDTLVRLRAAYKDWNELRVSQAQEINGFLALGDKGVKVAHDVREYLQEVFQRSHGMDLEFLKDDPQSTQRFVSILPFVGMATAHYLLWIAGEHELPVTPALMRVLDRVGIVSRTASPKKARAAIEPVVPSGKELEFAYKFGDVATRWCDARKPICHECVLVDDCKYGKKAFRDWKVQQERLEQHRAREAARLAVLQQKEDERRQREDEKRKKREALEAEKRAKDAARLAKTAEKKKQAEAERVAKIKAAADLKAKREVERVRALKEAAAKKAAALVEAKKKAEQKRKDELKQKAAAKKAAEKAAAKKKLEAKKKSAPGKKKPKKR